jgi:cobalt/nickel transport protein
MSVGQRNILLLLVAIVIAGVPALMALGVIPPLNPDAEWAGGDGIIQSTVGEISKDYQPWFSNLFSPADLGIEPIMFGLQALIGSLLASGFLGWLVGRRVGQTGVESGERRTAMIVSAIGIVVAIALFFVSTELGELQAFLAAIQGVCIGTLAFFVGYPMGRKAGSTRAGVRATA